MKNFYNIIKINRINHPLFKYKKIVFKENK